MKFCLFKLYLSTKNERETSRKTQSADEPIFLIKIKIKKLQKYDFLFSGFD